MPTFSLFDVDVYCFDCDGCMVVELDCDGWS